jgi:probable F420-dependent oxidoreductase
VKIDVPLRVDDLADAQTEVQRLAMTGIDGLFTFEEAHDVFAPLVLAAAAETHLDLYTNVAIAFPRSPVHLSHVAYDLQSLTKGHFALGLGSQIRSHIEFRYGASWSRPAARMREMIEAIRAIFNCWQEGTPLEFRGEFTNHTLMPPLFDPGPNPYGMPPLWLGAVGPRMLEVAAQVADGLIVHPLCSERTLTEHTLPLIENGLSEAGRQRSSFNVVAGAIIGTWQDEAEKVGVESALRMMLSFYGSTPAYRILLDVEGYGDLQPELRQLTKEGRWVEMPSLIDDSMLDRFTVRGTPDEVGAGLVRRFAEGVDRVALSPLGGLDPEKLESLVAAARHQLERPT